MNKIHFRVSIKIHNLVMTYLKKFWWNGLSTEGQKCLRFH